MQAVPKFVEQRLHVVVREQSGSQLATLRRRGGEIADEVRHGVLRAGTVAAAVDRMVHPGSAALVRPGVEVEIELTDQRAGSVDNTEKADRGMPCRRLAF